MNVKKIKNILIIAGSTVGIIILAVLLGGRTNRRGVSIDNELADQGDGIREDIKSSLGESSDRVETSIEHNHIAREANRSVRSELEYALGVLSSAKERAKT